MQPTLLIRGVGVFHPLLVPQPGVFRPDSGVVQTARHYGELDLAVLILE